MCRYIPLTTCDANEETPAPSMNTIPGELLDLIIRELLPAPYEPYNSSDRHFTPSPDKSSLSAFSLTSRHLRVCALPYLFREIVLHHYPDPFSMCSHATLRGTEDELSTIKPLPAFLDFLEQFPHLCGYVRVLDVRLATSWPGRLRRYATVLAWNEALDAGVEAHVLAGVLERLGRLEVLALVDVEIQSQADGGGIEGNSVWRWRRRLESLYLGLSSRSLDVRRTLSYFENIDELHIVAPVGKHIIGGSSVLAFQSPGSLDIGALYFHEASAIHPFTELFKQYLSATSLKILSIEHPIMPGSREDMREFLIEFCDRVEDLRCSLVTRDNVLTLLPCEYIY